MQPGLASRFEPFKASMPRLEPGLTFKRRVTLSATSKDCVALLRSHYCVRKHSILPACVQALQSASSSDKRMSSRDARLLCGNLQASEM